MTKRTTGPLSAVVLTIALAAFTGSALAGNGHGNGTSGNSANAPGHNKDTSTSTSATSATAKGSASQNSASTSGMKPTNNTSKNTRCSTGGGGGSGVTCAPSSSNTAAVAVGTKDASKRYGNGHTAAQIATQNGAPSGTTLYGPGNSQPHKVQACPNSKHWVDVHAVKHYSSASCATSTTTQTGMTLTGPRSAGNGLGTASAHGGVLGVTATASGKAGNGNPAGGVLGALTTVGQGTLPFTGFPLWFAAVTALGLILFGVALRRAARETV
jgi:hypothetical protein